MPHAVVAAGWRAAGVATCGGHFVPLFLLVEDAALA